MLYYIHQTPLPLRVMKGGLGTRVIQVMLPSTHAWLLMLLVYVAFMNITVSSIRQAAGFKCDTLQKQALHLPS